MKFKKLIGYVVDNMVITGIETYYDLSTDKVEKAFIINDSYGINCELFVHKYIG